MIYEAGVDKWVSVPRGVTDSRTRECRCLCVRCDQINCISASVIHVTGPYLSPS